MAKFDFSNKHVLISGGSSGIGLALAKDLFRLGSHVTILARRKQILQEALSEIEPYRVHPDQELLSISADVSYFSALKKSLSKKRKIVDILINSAGVAYPGKFEELDQDIFSTVMDINYLGTVNLTKIIVPEMIENQSGYIVNLSSMAAVIGLYGYTAYAPSKYAVRGFSRCLRAEMGGKGINVSVVLPPDIDTPQLAFEHSILPEITRKINENGTVLSPEKVSADVIRGIRHKKFTIVPGFEAKLIYAFAPIFGRIFYRLALKYQKK